MARRWMEDRKAYKRRITERRLCVEDLEFGSYFFVASLPSVGES